LNDGAAPADDRDLAFLHNLPELQHVDLARQDVSDEFLAKLVRNLDSVEVLVFSGTAAGEKTVQALIEHPLTTTTFPSTLWLDGTAITREDAERLKAARPMDEIFWTAPVSAADRKRLQFLFPVVAHSGEWGKPALIINLQELTPEKTKRLNELSGSFDAIDFRTGNLDEDLALDILREKDTSKISIDGVVFEHLRWLQTIPSLHTLDLQGVPFDEFRDQSRLFGMLPKLRKLSVSRLRVEDLSLLEKVPNLTHLYIYSHTLADADIKGLLSLQKLETLEFWGVDQELSDACLPTLAKFPHLRSLSVAGTKIRDVDSLLAFPALEDLQLPFFPSPEEFNRISKLRPGLVIR